MDYCQILRWKILNDKVSVKDGYYYIYLWDEGEVINQYLEDEHEYNKFSPHDPPEYSSSPPSLLEDEDLVKRRYGTMIKQEITNYELDYTSKPKSEPDEYQVFLKFSTNYKMLEKNYNNLYQKWLKNKEINKPTARKQAEKVFSEIKKQEELYGIDHNQYQLCLSSKKQNIHKLHSFIYLSKENIINILDIQNTYVIVKCTKETLESLDTISPSLSKELKNIEKNYIYQLSFDEYIRKILINDVTLKTTKVIGNPITFITYVFNEFQKKQKNNKSIVSIDIETAKILKQLDNGVKIKSLLQGMGFTKGIKELFFPISEQKGIIRFRPIITQEDIENEQLSHLDKSIYPINAHNHISV
ncbi:hypothetical protein HON22_05550 [Candidatus Peregrinibacteria bacterium]|jgi:hypothetical protein|nr:hypothetical protein [Candidatus Peregrinibacteria bacterium]